ncbi:hypothetical protein ABIB25_002369 [Nakamurella sp. UYEF19]
MEQSTDVLARILLAAATYPTRPALSGAHGRTLRYRDLAIVILSTAKRLRRNGFLTGDRLLNGLRPSPTGVVLTLGTIAAGGIVVLPEPGTGGAGFAAAAELSAPRWAAADAASWASGAFRPFRPGSGSSGWGLPAVQGERVRTIRHGRWLPGVPSGSISTRSLTQGRGPSDEPLPDLRAAADTTALILFASSLLVPEPLSSTSPVPDRPRGILHTRGSFGVNLIEAAYRYEMDRRSRVYLDDLSIGLSALAVGAHWRLPSPTASPRTDPARFTKGIGRATHIHLATHEVTAVLGAIGERLTPAPTALRQVLVDGTSVSPELVTRTSSSLPHVRLLTVYGVPEIYPIAVGEALPEAGPKAGGGSSPSSELLAGVSARTPDGELTVGGPPLAVGYLDESSMAEYSTGDLAHLDGRRLVLLGRRHHLIRRGRTIIHPESYQAGVESLPGVGHAALLATTDDNGITRMILAVQPAGQPVNDHPLAGEPKQSNSRDDDRPDAQQISVLLGHPLAASVAAGLAGVVGDSALPDQIVVLSALLAGPDDHEVDRAALLGLVADVTAGEAGVPEAEVDGRRGRRRRLTAVRNPVDPEEQAHR